mmetsp:Transcript_30658/g.44578  ORF Transcript_30658/g.44578 Transcript_30658/m.44578 type:complete len:350 (+) Transcript_30658:175-1224(+)
MMQKARNSATSSSPSILLRNNRTKNIGLLCHHRRSKTLLCQFLIISIVPIVLSTPTTSYHNSAFVNSSCLDNNSQICGSQENAAAAISYRQSKRYLNNMRAWTCHGRTQREMVEKLAAANIIKTDQVRQCLLRVDRANYAPERYSAYTDAPQPLGYGQTISAPHMHAHTLEELLPSLISASRNKPDTPLSILDVGCGSGYLTAALGRLVDKGTTRFGGPISPLVSGNVYGIDVVPELVDMSKINMKKDDADLLHSGTVTVQLGDGWKGLPDKAPFHAIHVGAAADDFPHNLMMQLAVGGVMVIPVGPDGGIQNLYRVEKLRESPTFHGEDFAIDRLLGVRYVPLVRIGP